MSKKNKPSFSKQIKIQSNRLIKNSERGTFFNIKNNNPDRFIAIIRITTSPQHYNELISEIEKYPYSQTNLLTSKVKKEISGLNNQKLVYLNFDSEFSWAKNILLNNHEIINEFIENTNKFSDCLVSEKFEEAGLILNQIEEKFGYSIWLIKNKIAYLQIIKGLESQKKFSQKIKTELKNGSLTRFIVHWLSVRNEKQTSIIKFKSQVESILNNMNGKKYIGFPEYIKYHLFNEDELDIENFIHVLRLEYSTSLYDYYEAFVSLIRVMSLSNSDKIINKLQGFFNSNNYHIIDKRLDIIENLLGFKEVTQKNTFLSEKYELLFSGNKFQTSKNNYEDESESDDIIPNTYLRCIKSKQIRKSSLEKSLKFKIENLLEKIIENGSINAGEEFTELKKIIFNFSCFKWASALGIILSREENLFFETDNECELLALKTASLNPDFLNCYKNNVLKANFIKICENHFSENINYSYQKSYSDLNVSDKTKNLSVNFKHLLNGIIEFKKGNYNQSIEYSEKLIDSDCNYFSARGYGLLAHSYLNQNKLVQTCTTISNCYVKDKKNYSFLPLNEILSKIQIGTDEWEEVNSIIDFPIILDVYFKYFNKTLEVERRFSYEDFLNENNMQKPFELIQQKNFLGISIDKIIYYLRFLCVESVMDTSSAFENGSEEILEERLNICRALSNIDSKNEMIYKQEINDIVKRQIIKDRRKEIDQSKIYIDIQNVHEWSEIELLESFNRYKAYILNNIDNLTENNLKSQKLNLSNSISTPDNEVKELLRFLVEEINKFYLSPDIGLDRFLSTRIRHGILERHLINPIEKHKLITKREFKNGPYIKNDYWKNKLTINSSKKVKDLDFIFNKFSDSYYKLINEILEWLQINNSKGLLNFYFSDEEILMISKKIDQETTIKEFISLVISNHLEPKLMLSLINIRERLNTEAKAIAKKTIHDLREMINNFCQANSEFETSINQARIDLQNQFDNIIEWFNPPSSGNSTPYFIKDAIIVAEAQIKESYPNFSVSTISDEEVDGFYIHGHFPIFIDILVNVFENVVKRSKLEVPQAEVNVWKDQINESLTKINLQIENKLGSNIDVEKLRTEMKRTLDLLSSESYSEFLAKERNSGLFKIHKSIMDLKVPDYENLSSMDVKVTEDKFIIVLSALFSVHTLSDDENI